jgi:hypothetical protein
MKVEPQVMNAQLRKRFRSQYEEEIRATLGRGAPAPQEVPVNPLSYTSSPSFLMLGSLAAALEDLATAKQWFALCLRANNAALAHSRSKSPVWPPADPRMYGPKEASIVNEIAICSTLTMQDTTNRVELEEARVFLPILPLIRSQTQGDSAQGFIEWLFGQVPDLNYDGGCTELAYAIVWGRAFPSYIVGDQSALANSVELMRRLEKWIRSIGATPEELDRHTFIGARLNEAFLALVDDKRDQFWSSFVAMTRLYLPGGKERHLDFCHHEALSLYLLGAKKFGAEPRGPIRGIPPGFSAPAYWKA